MIHVTCPLSVKHIQTLARHPSLFLHLNSGDAEVARLHVQKDLKRASQVYNDIVESEWSPASTLKQYSRLIPCQHNAYLYGFCRYYRPEVVIETGVYYGGSSAFVLKALEDNGRGHLYSIDLPNVSYVRDDGVRHDDTLPKRALTGYAVPAELRNRWTLVMGDSRRELSSLLRTVGRCDLFHHDSEHTYSLVSFEFETVLPFLADNGILLCDDVTWSKAFSEFCALHHIESMVVGEIGFARIANEVR